MSKARIRVPTALACSAFLLGTLSVATWAWRDVQGSEVGARPRVVEERVLYPPVPREGGHEPARAVAQARPVRPVVETMRDFWGKDWAGIREQFLSAGFEEELAQCLPVPPPWEEVKDQVLAELYPRSDLGAMLAAQYEWPGLATPQGLEAKGFAFQGNLTTAELIRIDEIVASFAGSLAEASHAFADLVGVAFRSELSSGAIRRGPHFLPPNMQPTNVVWQHVVRESGWAVAYELRADRHPELVEQQELLGALKHERFRSIQKFLDTR